jgi:serine/threonine protein kinase
VEKYMVENKLCLALVHPNIVRYFGLSIQYPNVALVFELCERGSLFQILADRRPAVRACFAALLFLWCGAPVQGARCCSL